MHAVNFEIADSSAAWSAGDSGVCMENSSSRASSSTRGTSNSSKAFVDAFGFCPEDVPDNPDLYFMSLPSQACKLRGRNVPGNEPDISRFFPERGACRTALPPHNLIPRESPLSPLGVENMSRRNRRLDSPLCRPSPARSRKDDKLSLWNKSGESDSTVNHSKNRSFDSTVTFAIDSTVNRRGVSPASWSFDSTVGARAGVRRFTLAYLGSSA